MSDNAAPSRPTAAQRTIRPAYLAHIVLRTGRYRELVEWYRAVLNADVAHEADNITFLTFDDEHHRIAIAKMPVLGKRSKARPGVDHAAFTYASLADLLATHSRLEALGIRPIWCINHGPTTSLYYEDPDGNVVELQIDNFASNEELDAWMVASDFATNPIGVDFDPSDLKRRLDAGEPESELTDRPRIGPRNVASIPAAYLGTTIALLARIAKSLGMNV